MFKARKYIYFIVFHSVFMFQVSAFAVTERPVCEPALSSSRNDSIDLEPTPWTEELRNEAEKMGPILEWDPYKNFNAYLLKITKILLPWQKELINKRAKEIKAKYISAQFHLINSTEVNAAVATLWNPDRQGHLTNHVVITTGLIKFLYKNAETKNKNFDILILGVLAHELAHPAEHVQERSFQSRWSSSSQGREALADHDALYLLREAGLPEEALYEALQIILPATKKSKSTSLRDSVRLGFSSHPEDGLRKGLHRIDLTIGGHAFGKTEQKAMITADLSVAAEIKAIANRRPKNKNDEGTLMDQLQTPLKSLAEVQSAIDAYVNQEPKSNGTPATIFLEFLRFNHLMQILAEKLPKKSADVDPEFANWLVATILRTLSGELPAIVRDPFLFDPYPNRFIEKLLVAEYKKIHPVPFSTLMSQSALIQSSEFKRKLRQAFLKRFGSILAQIRLQVDVPAQNEKDSINNGTPPKSNQIYFADRNGLNEFLRNYFTPEYWFELLQPEWMFLSDTLISWRNKVPKLKAPKAPVNRENSKYIFSEMGNLQRAVLYTPESLGPMGQFLMIHRYVQNLNRHKRLFEQETKLYKGKNFFNPFLVWTHKMAATKPNSLQKLMPSYFERENEILSILLTAKKAYPQQLREYVDIHFENATALLKGDLFWLTNAGRSYSVDWVLLYKLKDQDPRLSEIQKIFKDFAQSEEFYQWIRSNLTTFREHKALDYEEMSLHIQNPDISDSISLQWWTSAMAPYLLGERNKFIQSDARLRNEWRKLALYSLYFIDHSLFIREITNDLKLKMNSKIMTFDEWVNEVYSFVATELDEVKRASAISGKQIGLLNVLVEAAVLYVDALAEVQIPNKEKLKLIQVWSDWAPWTNSKFAPQLRKSLQRIQDLGTPSELLRRKPLIQSFGYIGMSRGRHHFLNERAFAHWEDDLTRELSAIQSPDEFEKKIDSIFNMAVKYTTPVSLITSDSTQLLDSTSAAYTRIINAAISVLKRLKMPLWRAFAAFQKITISGGTYQSDHYFEESLLPNLRSLKIEPDELKELANTLKGHHLKIAVAKIYFERIGFDQFNFLQSKADIGMFMGTLEKLAPGASFAKDDYIESLAWSMKINDLALLERLSEAKSLGRSSNISPYVINLASILSESFATMDPQEKWDLIRYLSTPENVDIPESTRKFVTNLVGKLPAGGDEANRKATRDNRVEALITHLKRLKQLPMLEKIPCIEFLLTNGQRPWIRDHIQLDKSWLALLGLQPESPMALALEDYLAVIPPHKISTTMAYLLARRGENLGLGSGSMKDLFEMFRIVGPKIGQGAHTWKLGQHHESLRDLKDRGTAMTKLEIKNNLRHSFGDRLANQIEIIKVLAAGSIKTVSLVKLPNGTMGALLTQSEYAERQVRATLELMDPFVARLQARGIFPQGAFVSKLLSRLHTQLARELDFRNEANALIHAKGIFAKVQSELGPRLHGYKIQVPQPIQGFPVTKKTLLVEFAPGEALDRLPKDDQAVAGPLILQIYSRALLGHGWIDADRSVANQNVDPKQKLISIIDLGQAEQLEVKLSENMTALSRDDRSHLLEMVLALQGGRVESIEAAVNPLLTEDSRPAWHRNGRAQFHQEWQKQIQAMANQTMDAKLILLVNVLENLGIQLEDKYSLYALKGILTLLAEPYADRDLKEQIIKANAMELVLEKKLQILFDFLPDVLGQFTAPQR